MHKRIPLRGKYGAGKFALVDADYYDWLMEYTWMVLPSGYIYCSPQYRGKKYRRYLHRMVAGTPEGMDTDHVNGDRLDNRRSNLRICTRQQNLWNSKPNSRSISGFKGVSPAPRSKNWTARVQWQGKHLYIGTYKTKEAAARAYNKKIIELRGRYAYQNPLPVDQSSLRG